MCGISGIVGAKDSYYILKKMSEMISHRGPDGSGIWTIDRFGLSHLRLSIIDLSSSGLQPMTDNYNGNKVIFNGEIYNYLELKSELKHNYQFSTATDTEVILACYRKYGIQFLSRLRGMFSLALYDAHQDKLLLARDRVGMKPLYYRKKDSVFYFSSEIKGLIDPEIFGTTTINDGSASEFLFARQLDTHDDTMFSEVKQLRPGHYILLNRNSEIDEYHLYWDIKRIDSNSLYEFAKDDLIEKMDETVRLHLRSDVPIGAFVSGGIDSSCVASFALRNLKEGIKLHTYSAILKEKTEENRLIPLINKHPNCIPHEFVLDGDTFFDDIQKVTFHHDEPLLDGSMFSHYKLCELAHMDGVKVLVSGAGGDELFGGYLSHISSYLALLLKDMRFKKFHTSIFSFKSNSEYTASYLFAKAIQETLPFVFRRTYKQLSLAINNRHIRLAPNVKHFYFEDKDPWFSNLINNYKSWTTPPYLHYEDRNSMAFGIEIRVPFYDHKLMEYVNQIALDQLMAGRSKSLLRNAFDSIVPEPILNQKGKFGFPSPIDRILKESKKSRELYFDLVPNNPYFKRNEAIKLGDSFFKGKADLGIYWRALSFSIWHSVFFRG